MNMQQQVAEVRARHFAYPPAEPGLLQAAQERGVPACLLEFHAICDGALIGPGDDFLSPAGQWFRFRIPSLADLQTTQEYGFIQDDSPLYTASAAWWQMLDYGDSNWLAIDATSNGQGRILDVCHESAGDPGWQEIVARSFQELIDRLLAEPDTFWFGDGFQSLGSV
ncbi:MAG: hypothetical protein AB7I37_05190 [Pirellulales bacterium]